MHLIVLASGKGSRLGQLTKDKPKCFLKVDGKYIIEHLAPIFEHFEKVFIVVGLEAPKSIETRGKARKQIKHFPGAPNGAQLLSFMMKTCFFLKSFLKFKLDYTCRARWPRRNFLYRKPY